MVLWKKWVGRAMGNETIYWDGLTALRTELPVICATSIYRSCLGSSHFACPASSLKLTNWKIFRAGFEPGSCFFHAWFVPFSSLVFAIFEPSFCHLRAWFVPLSSPVCAIFEPASCHFRACFVPYPSIVHASIRCSRLISFTEGSEEETCGEGNKEASLEATC